MLQALDDMKTGKAPELSDTSFQLISASGGFGIQVTADICWSPILI